MLMPGRKYPSTIKYRYGFNGKENDNEVKGEGNQQDYGMRIYDPRLGRFLSVDPLYKSYPELTSYQFAGNTPIQAKDLDGGEPQFIIGFFVGAIAELAEQTISIVTDNLNNNRSMFEGWGNKIDLVDVAISGIQGAIKTLPGVGIGAEVISEVTGNYVKSAVDGTTQDGVQNVFDNSKSMGAFEKDFVINSIGSIAGIAPVSKVTTETISKIKPKVVVKNATKAVVSGSRTGAYEAMSGLVINELKNKPTSGSSKQSPSNTNRKSNSTNTSSPKSKSPSKGKIEKNFDDKNSRIYREWIDDKGVQHSEDKPNPNYKSKG
jgi:RHS repeat-associated protein